MSMTVTQSKPVTVTRLMEELADREAIRQCLYRYSRGVDRLDADTLRSAYWPDAIDNHLEFKGTVDEFIAWAFPMMEANMDQSCHLISNVLIKIRGNQADVESYFHGVQRVKGEQGPMDVTAVGRYIDRFEKRDDEWRIAERLVLTDWFRQFPDSADWSKGLMGMAVDAGAKFPDDPSYTMLDLA